MVRSGLPSYSKSRSLITERPHRIGRRFAIDEQPCVLRPSAGANAVRDIGELGGADARKERPNAHCRRERDPTLEGEARRFEIALRRNRHRRHGVRMEKDRDRQKERAMAAPPSIPSVSAARHEDRRRADETDHRHTDGSGAACGGTTRRARDAAVEFLRRARRRRTAPDLGGGAGPNSGKACRRHRADGACRNDRSASAWRACRQQTAERHRRDPAGIVAAPTRPSR